MSMSYNDWLKQVDREVRKLVNVSLYDLQDWLSRDAYDAGVSPSDAAVEAIENDGSYDGILDEIYDD